MKFRPRFWLIIFGMVFLLSQVSAGTLTNFPYYEQEKTEWCWAATSEMVLVYYGWKGTQDEIGQLGTDGVNTWNWLYGQTSNPTRYGVNLILQTLNNKIQSEPVEDKVTFNEIKQNISKGNPVPIRWGWDNGGGHILIIAGYTSSNQTVELYDPWPGNGHATVKYSWVKSGDQHTWTHTLLVWLLSS
ncbi:MAG: hypothetical protein GY750_04410 [Lentisphaerae bacterium]|nr:hypothetical protein [Lentisphaerota bacterium]MCP4100654.1 hypothetical protein [Lentisphaerota bacterium]